MSRNRSARLSVWRPTKLERVLRGAPHYPEHVDPSIWDSDARRMAEAGANVVRMGEFAWHLWEPYEGHFAFDLFDRAIANLGAHGIDTILCTPTATPPRWLTRDYPEVLRVDTNGQTAQHGSRQHADTTSPVFRRHSRRITQALATHYKDNPHVIGWQTDNELNNSASESYSPSCRLAFQVWLRQRYDGSVAALNDAWGGHFWALAYDSFADIELPRAYSPTFPAPGHLLDYHRFLAASVAEFQSDQVEILRATNPDWFLFHDLGSTNDIDFRGQFGQDVDFLGFNVYPMLYDEFDRPGGHAIAQAWRLDQVRAYSGNFIVPEQAAGIGSQPGFSTMTPEPGEMRRMALSSIARGADGLMFFRWRPAHFGAEIYWTGLLDHDNTPRRRYGEAAQVFGELARLEPMLLGTHVRMDIGIAGADFDAQEAHKTYSMGLPSPKDDAFLLYAECYSRNIACGLIHPEDDLSPLKALYVPHWVIWKPEWTKAVAAFVEQGGTLILSALTGTRDEMNRVPATLAPGGGLSDLAGVTVEEFGRLAGPGASGLGAPVEENFAGAYVRSTYTPAESGQRRYSFRLGNQQVEAGHLYEKLIIAEGTQAHSTWADGWLAGSPAITSRTVGKGRVFYVGTYLTPTLAPALLQMICASTGVAPLLENLPEGVEVTIRQSAADQLMFVANTTALPVSVPDLPAGKDILTGRPHQKGAWILNPYACCVIQLDAT